MKNILITGGSRGIGLECVKRFHQDGWNVITCSRNKKTWLENLTLYPELCNVDYVEIDVSDDGDLNRLFSYIGGKYSYINAAVNNASPKIISQGEFSEVPAENLFSTLKSDFWSYVVCLQKELNLMNSGSCIVNVSSVNGLRPCPGAAIYSAAKHGLEGLTRSVALEAIQKGIRVNAVAPGVTWTSRWEERKNSNPNIREEIETQIPIKRFAIESEIVNAIEWLCCAKSSYVVGHTLVVDGGLSLD
ncbi:dehydrogenase [Cellvibrio mixtus]|uniref:Dehydrogenase n=1 Tax=Cellvibrio mixtus TaxID=39650 RepID=A0A266Q2X1_9GAMM|nr:SDR family oxidoreductase [Cellvibrio mixtus]OZY83731.1 dehydrogenase [Cellvibrio mixtus]